MVQIDFASLPSLPGWKQQNLDPPHHASKRPPRETADRLFLRPVSPLSRSVDRMAAEWYMLTASFARSGTVQKSHP
jgi:hypothetical protein